MNCIIDLPLNPINVKSGRTLLGGEIGTVNDKITVIIKNKTIKTWKNKNMNVR